MTLSNPFRRVLARITVKGLALFGVVVLIAALTDPVRPLSRVTIYNTLVPGRQRLPWGERPELAFNVTVNNVDAMFASHEIARPKAADEFRVVLVGDSSTWGFLLKPEDTLSALLNAKQLRRNGKRVRVYNLGYPDFSLSKDGALLLRSLEHQPDLVIWLVTLRSFPKSLQKHALLDAINPAAGDLAHKRRALADLLRLQLFGVAWAATGLDQHYPADYTPVQRDLDADQSFGAFAPPTLPRDDLSYGVFDSAQRRMGTIPLIVVNEPMLVSTGANSDVRYNFFYPRWAYDRYRLDLVETLQSAGIRHYDYWNLVPQIEFTNSAVHLTPAGSRMLADRLAADVFPP
jgi:hypothetical protein